MANKKKPENGEDLIRQYLKDKAAGKSTFDEKSDFQKRVRSGESFGKPHDFGQEQKPAVSEKPKSKPESKAKDKPKNDYAAKIAGYYDEYNKKLAEAKRESKDKTPVKRQSAATGSALSRARESKLLKSGQSGKSSTLQDIRNQIGENMAKIASGDGKTNADLRLSHQLTQARREYQWEEAGRRYDALSDEEKRERYRKHYSSALDRVRANKEPGQSGKSTTAQETRNQIGENIAKRYYELEDELSDPTKGGEYAFINRVRSAAGETVENIGNWLYDNFGYEPGKEVYEKGEARKIGEIASGQFANEMATNPTKSYRTAVQVSDSLANMLSYKIATGPISLFAGSIASEAAFGKELAEGASYEAAAKIAAEKGSHMANSIFSGGMAFGTFGDTYNQSRAEGQGKLESTIRATAAGAISYITEAMGGIGGAKSPLNKLESAAKQRWITNLLYNAFEEGGEELVEYSLNYLTQGVIDLAAQGKWNQVYDLNVALDNAKNGFWSGGVVGLGNVALSGGQQVVNRLGNNTYTGNAETDAKLDRAKTELLDNLKTGYQASQDPVVKAKIESQLDATIPDTIQQAPTSPAESVSSEAGNVQAEAQTQQEAPAQTEQKAPKKKPSKKEAKHEEMLDQLDARAAENKAPQKRTSSAQKTIETVKNSDLTIERKLQRLKNLYNGSEGAEKETYKQAYIELFNEKKAAQEAAAQQEAETTAQPKQEAPQQAQKPAEVKSEAETKAPQKAPQQGAQLKADRDTVKRAYKDFSNTSMKQSRFEALYNEAYNAESFEAFTKKHPSFGEKLKGAMQKAFENGQRARDGANAKAFADNGMIMNEDDAFLLNSRKNVDSLIARYKEEADSGMYWDEAESGDAVQLRLEESEIAARREAVKKLEAYRDENFSQKTEQKTEKQTPKKKPVSTEKKLENTIQNLENYKKHLENGDMAKLEQKKPDRYSEMMYKLEQMTADENGSDYFYDADEVSVLIDKYKEKLELARAQNGAQTENVGAQAESTRAQTENIGAQAEIKTEKADAQAKNSSAQKNKYKKLAHPELGEMRDNIFAGKNYTLKELKDLSAIKEAEKRANLDSAETSTQKFTDKDTGEWLPERKAIHDRIINELTNLGSAVIDSNGKVEYNGVVEQGRHADIVIGPPAAGKSTVFADPLSQKHKAKIIDSDMVKERLPEFDGGYGANFIHDESTRVATADLTSRALEKGENVVFPLVGGKTKKIRNLIKSLREKGYTVNLYYNEVSSEIAMNRAFARFVQNGRFLPLDYVAGIYKDPKQNPTVTYYELLKEGVADYYEHKSNAVPYGTEPPLVESPTGRDLYRPGNKGEIQPERPIRQGGNSGRGNLAGDVQSEKINQRADAESSGFFNAQNSAAKTQQNEYSPEYQNGAEHPETVGAMESDKQNITRAINENGALPQKKKPFSDFDRYKRDNDIPSGERAALARKINDPMLGEITVAQNIANLAKDGAKFIEQDGKYYAQNKDGSSVRVSKSAYNYGKWLNDNGVFYTLNQNAEVPKKINGKYVSKSVTTFIASRGGTDAMVESIAAGIERGQEGFTYERKTHSHDIQYAMDTIREKGFDGAVEFFEEMANGDHRFTVELSALGSMLSKIAEDAYVDSKGKNKDAHELAVQIGAWMGSQATNAGQVSESMKIMREIVENSGEMYYERLVESLQEKYKKRLKGKEITLDAELLRKVAETAGTKEYTKWADKLNASIANQIPSSWGEKVTAWAYFCMLSSGRTHMKNIISNAAMFTMVVQKNLWLSAFERIYKKKHPEYMLTTSGFKMSKESRKSAKEVLEKMDLGTDKYNSEAGFLKDNKTNTMQGNGKWSKLNVPGWVADRLSGVTTGLLSAEDAVAKKMLVMNRISQVAEANHWSPEFLNDTANPEAIKAWNTMADIGLEEAMKGTFNNPNAIVPVITAYKNMKRTDAVSRVAKAAVGAFIELNARFKNVPANIAATAARYSPAGLLVNLTKDYKLVREGSLDARTALENSAKGMTGTTVSLGAMLLSYLGLLTVGRDADEDKPIDEKEDTTMYLKIPDKKNGDLYIAIDWIDSVAMQFRFGVELKNLLDDIGKATKGEETFDAWGSLVGLATRSMDTFTNLGMMESLKNLLLNKSGADDASDLFSNSLANFANQLIPRIVTDIRQALDKEKRNTYYKESTDEYPKWLQVITSVVPQSTVNQFRAAYGDRSELPARLDEWGNSLVEQNKIKRMFESVISPFKTYRANDDKVQQMLDQLDAKTDKNVFPPDYPKFITVNGEKVNLSGKEYEEVARKIGKERYKLLDELGKDREFQKLSPDKKAELIQDCYNIANEMAKYGFDDDYSISKITQDVKDAKKEKLSIPKYLRAKQAYDNMSEYEKDGVKISRSYQFADYLMKDTSTTVEEDIKLIELIERKKDGNKYKSPFENIRKVPDTSDKEILSLYVAFRDQADKEQDLQSYMLEYGYNSEQALARYNVAKGSKATYDSLGNTQKKKADKLLAAANKGRTANEWNEEKIALAASAVTSIGDYGTKKTMKSYIAMLTAVGFTESEAKEFYKYYA